MGYSAPAVDTQEVFKNTFDSLINEGIRASYSMQYQVISTLKFELGLI